MSKHLETDQEISHINWLPYDYTQASLPQNNVEEQANDNMDDDDEDNNNDDNDEGHHPNISE